MTTIRMPDRSKVSDFMFLCAGLLCVLLLAGGLVWSIWLWTEENSQEYSIRQEAEHVRETHTDKSVDPSGMAPYRSLPYVIADDDLCRITITGKPLLANEFVTGYERLRSYKGDVFQLTIENKSDKLTIRVGLGEDWVARGRYSFDGKMIDEENMACSYQGFLNLIEPGKEHRGEFSVFAEEHGNLEYVDALYGWFDICDDKNQTIALYPFSWEDFDGVTAKELPTTFIDDDTCRFALTDLSWDEGREQWVWSYEAENKSDRVARLVSEESFHVAGSDGKAFASFNGQDDKSSSGIQPGDTIRGTMTFHETDGKTGEATPCATNREERPLNMYGVLSLVTGSEGDDGSTVLSYLPIYVTMRS